MKKISIGIVSFFLLWQACTPKEIDAVNDEELITTVIYTLTPKDPTKETVVMTFQDVDGDGGIAPITTITGKFSPVASYNGKLTMLNESVNPVIDISEEVQEEGLDHQVFYQWLGIDNAVHPNISYTDQDSGGFPIGLTTAYTSGVTNKGNLTITLRHEPTKAASGVAEGNIDNAGGETDVEVRFVFE